MRSLHIVGRKAGGLADARHILARQRREARTNVYEPSISPKQFHVLENAYYDIASRQNKTIEHRK